MANKVTNYNDENNNNRMWSDRLNLSFSDRESRA